jgi:hypothetical protein
LAVFENWPTYRGDIAHELREVWPLALEPTGMACAEVVASDDND